MTSNAVARASDASARPPVRVKLKWVNASMAENHPPGGVDSVGWWNRLQAALGTTSSDFVSAALYQLQAVARLPGSGICETAVNAALALIERIAPRDEVEAVLAVQMACTHAASMVVLARIGGGSERHVIATTTAATKLLKAYILQEEALRRRRGGGRQHVRVEHVHVNEGGQAIIGNVTPQ
jgi:hypothetical protein